MFRRNGNVRSLTLTTAFAEVEAGNGDAVLIQCSAAIRITYGTDDALYFTYLAMTEPIIVTAGCRIRAETGTATLIMLAGYLE